MASSIRSWPCSTRRVIDGDESRTGCWRRAAPCHSCPRRVRLETVMMARTAASDDATARYARIESVIAAQQALTQCERDICSSRSLIQTMPLCLRLR
jgi:hypothetical protein